MNLQGSSLDPRASRREVLESFPIVELRQYSLRDGHRDTLIDLFERRFIEPQEELGMKVIGTFRDIDRPERFVWLRGFADMGSRLEGLTAFYGGPVWRAHREAANATMIDSDNVLLLRAPTPSAAFQPSSPRPRLNEEREAGRVVAFLCELKASPTRAAETFETQVKPRLEASEVAPLAWFVTATSPNNFPALPIRENERVLVWFARFENQDDQLKRMPAIDQSLQALLPLIANPPEMLRLEPTSRSELR